MNEDKLEQTRKETNTESIKMDATISVFKCMLTALENISKNIDKINEIK